MTRLEKELNSLIDSLLFPSRTATTFNNTGSSYPPYNILRVNEKETVLELAVAGFSENELSVIVEDDKLKISGKKEATDNLNYIYKGIGTRAFERIFTLSRDSKVEYAEYSDGILSVHVSYEIPEEKKPKNIQINQGSRGYTFLAETKKE